MIRYLIWDVDGTLFDTYPPIARAFAAALNDLGASAPLDRIEGMAKIRLSHCAATLANTLDVNLSELQERFEYHYGSTPLQEQPPFPGAIGICEYVHAIGGTNVIVTHRGRESTNRLLVTHNMTHHFADSLTRDDGYPRKPDPASFGAMIEKHGFRREETLAIGDRNVDILAGQAASIRTCFFGGRPEEAAADFTITDYAALHRLLVAENDRSGDNTPPGEQGG